jgi:hypothetical protein
MPSVFLSLHAAKLRITPSNCGTSSYNDLSSKITFNSYMFDEIDSCKAFMNGYLKPKAGLSRRSNDFTSKAEVEAATCTCQDLMGTLIRKIPLLDTAALDGATDQRSLCQLILDYATNNLKSAACDKATSFTFGFPFVTSLAGKMCETCFDAAGAPVVGVLKGVCTNFINIDVAIGKYSSEISTLIEQVKADVDSVIEDTAGEVCDATVCRDSSSGGGECSVIVGTKLVKVALQDQGLCANDIPGIDGGNDGGSTSNSTDAGNSGSRGSPQWAIAGIVSMTTLILTSST